MTRTISFTHRVTIDTVRVRYSAGNYLVNVKFTPTLTVVQVDQNGFTLSPKTIRSDEKVEDVVLTAFANARDAAVNSGEETAIESAGPISTPAVSKVAWLNTVKWWQQPGRLGFYWDSNSKSPLVVTHP